MYSCGALIVDSARLLLPSLREAVKLVKGVLYVPLTDTLYHDDVTHTSSRDLTLAADTIRQAYLQVAQISPNIDLRFILPSSYIPSPPALQPPSLSHRVGVVISHMTSSALGKSPSYQLLTQRIILTPDDLSKMFQSLSLQSSEEVKYSSDLPPLTRYDHVVLGGTFDHIHMGHRLLLTESILLARKRLLVGVTDGHLLESKILPELILSCDKRIERVKEFVQDVNWNVNYQIVPITDVYGPTAWDEDLECLVVTTETAKGSAKVNEERKRKGLSQLAVHTVKLVGSKVNEVGVVSDDEKLSSSDIRKSLLGIYREPVVNECLEYDPQSGPYIIGLTGAMATGKSSVLARLVEKGAYAIDCDKLGHETYDVGRPAYDKIISEFGEGVRGSGGKINRRALGAIVFKDKVMLDRLNDIVWPEIWKLVEVKVQDAGRQGYKVCVVDAAVMVMAGWHCRVHQVWTTICPRKESVRRVMERNDLSEDEATRRLSLQPPSQVYVDHAHIIIGTQWEPEVTKGQVERAWLEVMETIKQ